jgi:hypothetical protein
MVVRSAFRCQTCDQDFALRIGVGHEPSQRHFFLCPHCEEECSIYLTVDFETPAIQLKEATHCEEQANIAPKTTKSWKVVNLHPDFVIPFDAKNSDDAFPWLRDMGLMFERLKHYHDPNLRVADLHELLNFNDSFSTKWQILSRVLGHHIGGRSALAHKTLRQYKWIFNTKKTGILSALVDFCRGMLFPAMLPPLEAYEAYIAELHSEHSEQLSQFLAYYNGGLNGEHLRRYKQILDDYFRDYTEYKQTLNYIRCGLEQPRGSYASSCGFEQVRMFYGTAFEVLTSHFTVPACINNIANGRAFDRFEKMDLALYLNIDKANRGNPFKNNENLNFLLEGIDSQVRNASHHANMRLLKGRDTIEYKSGKNDKTKNMSYAEYIWLCNRLLVNLLVSLVLETHLLNISEK